MFRHLTSLWKHCHSREVQLARLIHTQIWKKLHIFNLFSNFAIDACYHVCHKLELDFAWFYPQNFWATALKFLVPHEAPQGRVKQKQMEQAQTRILHILTRKKTPKKFWPLVHQAKTKKSNLIYEIDRITQASASLLLF